MVLVRPLLVAALSLALPVVTPPVAAQCLLCDKKESLERPSAAALLANDPASTAVSAPLGATPTLDGEPSEPLQVEIRTALDFDRIIMASSTAGRASIGPDGSTRVEGGVQQIGGRSLVGEIVVHGEPLRPVTVRLPRTIEMYGTRGGIVRIESLQSDVPDNPALDANGQLSFRVGGDLAVDGDLDGEFRGNFTVDVDYL